MAHRWEPSTKDCRVLITEDEYFLGEDLAQALQCRHAPRLAA